MTLALYILIDLALVYTVVSSFIAGGLAKTYSSTSKEDREEGLLKRVLLWTFSTVFTLSLYCIGLYLYMQPLAT